MRFTKYQINEIKHGDKGQDYTIKPKGNEYLVVPVSESRNTTYTEMFEKIDMMIEINHSNNIYENLAQSIDFVNKMKYNEYTNIDKLIYQIN